MAEQRKRKFWGWGYEDERPSPEEGPLNALLSGTPSFKPNPTGWANTAEYETSRSRNVLDMSTPIEPDQ